MNAIVPDTFQGAVILSVIDFFLSFLIISGIGFVLSLFPLLNKTADLLNGKAAHAKTAKPVEKKATVAAKPAAAAAAQELPEMAAIAAAVAVMMDGTPHHIISIDPAASGAWVQSGRLAHHGSHLGAH